MLGIKLTGQIEHITITSWKAGSLLAFFLNANFRGLIEQFNHTDLLLRLDIGLRSRLLMAVDSLPINRP